MIVAAFDPGKTTGVAIGSIDSGEIDLLETFEIRWEHRFQEARLTLTSFKPQVVVMESFNLFATHRRKLARNDFPAVRMIGVIEAYCHLLLPQTEVRFQSPSSRKRVAIVHDLPKSTAHTRDAYQHLRLYALDLLVNGGVVS